MGGGAGTHPTCYDVTKFAYRDFGPFSVGCLSGVPGDVCFPSVGRRTGSITHSGG